MLAIVNGEPITMTQFYKHLEVKPSVQVLVNPATLQASGSGQIPQQPYNGQVIGSLGLQGLTDLVHQAILRQLAKDDKVYPTQADIQAELSDRTKDNPGFVPDLVKAGYTKDMIENELALQLAEYNLTTEGVTVTDKDVDDYIKEHPTEFVQPEQVELLWILAPDDQTKKQADTELKSGATFINVAQKYSKAPNAAKMGFRFMETSVPKLANYGPDLLPAIKKTDVLQQTPWLKFTEGWAKFYVNKRTPERKLPIDDAMKKKVHRALAVRKGAQGKDLNSRLQDKLRNSKVVVVLESLRDPWKNAMDEIQNQSGTKPATTGNP